MPYALGIDIRAASTVAAVARLYQGRWEPPELVPSATMPSTLLLAADGPVAGVEGGGPDVVRGFLDRIGDEVPLVVGGRPYRAANLAAELIDQVARRVEAAEGGPARQVAGAGPGPWGADRPRLPGRAAAPGGLRGRPVPGAGRRARAAGGAAPPHAAPGPGR